MALRLRKDVQKASYYVWFLGAEEARGLRGPRVLLPAIPRLIERSREQEQLKVTLQVSHKGMKIVQGTSKHFITHSAITCSVQADDIVACVLLLYNPTTKCPLHVHAYRCDSETTAQALHQFLQVLINRPENQKRFAELETRLGLQTAAAISSRPTQSTKPPQPSQKRTETSPKRFESSLGSDTGTSTRESECSEELSPTSPPIPVSPVKASLFDSLAAELRAKLNGNGPPLLLPPRDYDTVHRSKGNLAAIELRRCRNSLIVGGPGNNSKKADTSRSRGSSGIGSDLAPSPEQNDGHSSSDEEWMNQEKPVHHPSKSPRRPQPIRTYSKEKSFESLEDIDQPPSYLYPRDSPMSPNKKKDDSRFESRSASRDDERDRYYSREEEIKPIIIRPKNFDFRFKDILDDRKFVGQGEKEKNRDEEQRYRNNNNNNVVLAKERQEIERTYRQNSDEKLRDDNELPKERENYRFRSNERKPIYDKEKDIERDEKEDLAYRENLTDRQKYKESLMERQKSSQTRHKERSREREYYVPEPIPRESYEKMKTPIKSKYKYENCREKISAQNENTGSGDYRYAAEKNPAPPPRGYIEYEKSIERNPYKEPSSLPYRESIEKMIKSPVMKYKSFDNGSFNNSIPDEEHQSLSYNSHKVRESTRGRSRDPIRAIEVPPSKYDHSAADQIMSRRRIIEKQRSISPPETIMRISPKDRFQNAKEKFQAMESDRHNHNQSINDPIKPKQTSRHQTNNVGRGELLRRGSFEHPSSHLVQTHTNNRNNAEWSSDEDQPKGNNGNRSSGGRPMGGYRDMPPQRYSSGIESPTCMISPAKSLGNLVRGYRHSYAEPRNPLPRNSGRVGLAAVNPF